ncbi:MAG: sodium:solute symporter family protein [Candidatus Atribacteria bacterium]|nr:sodium:solute symporter family protein [Candidatus Atribacteria bacterium]
MSTNLILAVILIYAFWGSALAFLSRRELRPSLVDYFLASNKLHWLTASLSYGATTYSAFMMLGLAGLTYRGGVGALGFELIYLSGLICAVTLGPYIWKIGQAHRCVTPGEVLSVHYGSRFVGIAYALVSLTFLVPYTSVQLTGIGYLLETLSNGKISYFWGLTIATILAFLWVEIAGLRSVAITDSLQAGIMMVSSLFLVFILVYRFFGGWGGLFHALEIKYPEWLTVPGNGFFTFRTFLGLSLPWFFFSISNPQVSQRLLVPSSLHEMRKMLVGFLFYGFFYTLITIILGFSARALIPDLKNPDLATPTILAQFSLPAWVVLLSTLGILSAAVSTIDSIFLTLSSMFARDILSLSRRSEKERLLLVRFILIPILCFSTFLFALARFNLIALLSVASSAGLIAVVPAFVGGLIFKKGNAQAATLSILGGALISFVLQLFNLKPLGLWPGVITPLVATLLFGTLSPLSPKKSKLNR